MYDRHPSNKLVNESRSETSKAVKYLIAGSASFLIAVILIVFNMILSSGTLNHTVSIGIYLFIGIALVLLIIGTANSLKSTNLTKALRRYL